MERKALAIMLTVWSALLAGCGGSSNNTASTNTPGAGGDSTCPAPGASSGTFSGSLKIGSKPFAEEQLLAQITKDVLEKHGFTVDFSTQVKDPELGKTLEQGGIDMYWQYTGTELQGPLNVDKPPTDLQAAFDMAKQKDEARAQLCWTAQAKLDDTNGVAIRAADKAKYGSTLTEFGNYLASNPSTVVCIMSEFRTRADGLPGLEATYNKSYGAAALKDISGTAEKFLKSGDCAAGEVFTTDSGIAANDLYVLQDDKKFFPPDNVGLVVRSAVYAKHPEIAGLMQPVADKLDNATITSLNKQVEIDGLKFENVAKTWLTQNGFL